MKIGDYDCFEDLVDYFDDLEVDPDTVGEVVGEKVENRYIYEGDLIDWTTSEGDKYQMEIIFDGCSFVAVDVNTKGRRVPLSVLIHTTLFATNGTISGTIHDKEKT